MHKLDHKIKYTMQGNKFIIMCEMFSLIIKKYGHNKVTTKKERKKPFQEANNNDSFNE